MLNETFSVIFKHCEVDFSLHEWIYFRQFSLQKIALFFMKVVQRRKEKNEWMNSENSSVGFLQQSCFYAAFQVLIQE